MHREEVANGSEQKMKLALEQNFQIIKLIEQNTELTKLVKEMSVRIEKLTNDVHGKVILESKPS